MRSVDVLIAGAGPAGCAVAVQAASRGLSVAVLHREQPERRWAGESLPPGFGPLVLSLFGEEALSEADHTPAVGTRSVWGSDALVETDFITNPLGSGWLLDRRRFDAVARHAALAAGAVFLGVGHIGPPRRQGSAWQLDIGDGRCLSAGFLVDATGRSGALLRKLRVPRLADDQQIAVLATFEDDGDAFRGTTVEAVAEGWWYTTPLPDGKRVLCYLTDADIWRRGSRDWHLLLGQTVHVKEYVGRNATLASPRSYPATTSRAAKCAGETWLAVGDSAAAFDPLSSQGLASALLMGARAGEAIAHSDREKAITDWAGVYGLLIAEHNILRTHYARLENRWPRSEFWRRLRDGRWPAGRLPYVE